MKIIDVAEFYAERGGGVKTYIDLKLRAAREHGHELVVIAPGPEDAEERRLGGRVLWVRSRPLLPDPRYYMLLREKAVHALIDREAPDLVEGSSPWTGGWFVARYPRPVRKTFVFHHDPVAVYPQTMFGAWLGAKRVDDLCGAYWAYLRSLSSHFDATVVSGAWLAERLSARGIRNPVAVPFGIDKALFSGARPDPELRRELIAKAGADPSAKLLVTVSRHHPEKRLGTLFAALQRVAAKRPVALAVYGDGPLAKWSALRARGKPIYLAGLTRDRALLARVLASGDALLHGSSAETFGLVVAEAMCAGLPVIVPNAGGAGELARPSYAETYSAGDSRACAAAIERMLDRDSASSHAESRRAGEEHVNSQADHFRQLFATYEAMTHKPNGAGVARLDVSAS